jgi:hypothetical protein
MPRHRSGATTSFEVGGAEFYLTANPFDDGSLGEVFVKFGKQGRTLGGLPLPSSGDPQTRSLTCPLRLHGKRARNCRGPLDSPGDVVERIGRSRGQR